MISLMSQSHEFVIDKESELGQVPRTTHGDIVLVIETSNVYILNNQKEWKLLGENS